MSHFQTLLILKVKVNKEVEAFVFHISYQKKYINLNNRRAIKKRHLPQEINMQKRYNFQDKNLLRSCTTLLAKKNLEVKEAKKIIIRDNFRSYC